MRYGKCGVSYPLTELYLFPLLVHCAESHGPRLLAVRFGSGNQLAALCVHRSRTFSHLALIVLVTKAIELLYKFFKVVAVLCGLCGVSPARAHPNTRGFAR